jgi:predicted dehydrogenase
MVMKKINWGIIGCGDVTEVKSGPAFNKVPNSALLAVMRRDAGKAADYAARHGVPRWYSNADQLINDPEVNAIYIATPPSSHAALALAAIRAGKPVYVEKPMALDLAAATQIADAASAAGIKLVVAHYRRQWPIFKKLRELLQQQVIGDIRLARLEYYTVPMSAQELAVEKNAWRVNPAIAGGGLFNDLAPHQLDLMYHFFGPAKKITGIAANQAGLYAADDMVAGNILFETGVAFTGAWCFTAAANSDLCELTGSKGSIRFSFFSGDSIELFIAGKSTRIEFPALQHVQQPMIEQTVRYFLDEAPNPCTGEEGATIMQWIAAFTAR